HRHAPDGSRDWRRQRAECAAGPRCNRRSAVRDAGYLVLRTGVLQSSTRQAQRMTRRASRLRAIIVLIVVLAVAALVVVSGILPRLRAKQARRKQTTIAAEPAVTVMHPQRANPAEEVVLPGNIQAFIDAPIYARTNGYLKKWYFDIGAHVKRGQLLAEIESPEVDQQLQQARADLATNQADLKLAQITADRYVGLFKTDSVAKQDVDNAVQNAASKEAVVKSAQANVRRLEQLVS